jgi:molybdenum cofactor guanylyltransferase
MNDDNAVTAVVLAGGRARRMGGIDKGTVPFNGEPMVERICRLVGPQVDLLLVNANRNLDYYATLGYGIVEDEMDDYQGPLAGMHAALGQIRTPWLLTAPCDGPFIPRDYAARMLQQALAGDVRLSVAHDGERLQPVHALLHVSLAPDLGEFLQSGDRKIDRWYATHPYRVVDFSSNPELFSNINTPDQLAALENKFFSS